MLHEFREFAARGNVVDLAVGLVLGTAFGAIVNSLVNDILMPPIGWLTGGIDFSGLYVVLGSGEYASLGAAKQAGAATINYGVFINTILTFLIVSFAMFIVVRQMNRLRRRQDSPSEPSPGPATRNCPYCISTIPSAATRCPQCTSPIEAETKV
ncbi:MAG: large conductance mechanosensitive channel protein MscL [Alphaproteobacteria bacterium]|nr:large conductance mechanosensitive channel protein MscL [Alphaproteobacteria bacterium]